MDGKGGSEGWDAKGGWHTHTHTPAGHEGEE